MQSLNNLAVVLTSQGKAGEALSLLQAAISACPAYAGEHHCMLSTRQLAGHLAEPWLRVMSARSKCSRLAALLQSTGLSHTMLVACPWRCVCARVLPCTCGDAHIADGLPFALCVCGAEAHNNLGVLQRDVGAIPDALTSYERALRLVPDSRNAGQNRLLALNYIHAGEGPAVCAAHVEWGAAFQAQFAQHVLPEVLPAQRNTALGRPLRVRTS